MKSLARAVPEHKIRVRSFKITWILNNSSHFLVLENWGKGWKSKMKKREIISFNENVADVLIATNSAQ